MFERFTERARHVIVLAQDEARALRHPYIGTEHILLGLLRGEEGIAARALDALGVTAEKVRREVEAIVGRGHPDEIPTGQIPFTGAARNAIQRSLDEQLFFGDDYIGTEHLLLGLLREGEAPLSGDDYIAEDHLLLGVHHGTDDIVGRVLAALRLTPEAVRSETVRTLKEFPTEEVARRWVMVRTWGALEGAAKSVRTAKELLIDAEFAQAAEIGQIEASLRQQLDQIEASQNDSY